MQTQVMDQPAVGVPWLEFYPAAGGPLRRCYLESFPFTIGRHESTDLQINSTRVSREHAVIDAADGSQRVKDLGSTNGTFLNGRRIQEAPLKDGDLLLVADVELTFFTGQPSVTSSATQVMAGASRATADGPSPVDLICQLRRLRQSLTQCSMAIAFAPIVELATGRTVAFEAGDDSVGPAHPRAAAWQMLVESESRVSGQFREMRRMLAVERARNLPLEAALFLPVDASEMGAADLTSSLGALGEDAAEGRPLVIEVPAGAVCDLPHFHRFLDEVREKHVRVAYHGFSPAHLRLLQATPLRPDYLKLVPSLVRNLSHGPQRQRQFRSILDAGGALGCEMIAAGIENESDAETCRQLGCRLAQRTPFD